MTGNFNKQRKWRVGVVAILITVALIYVIIQLYSIQVIKFEEYQGKAIAQQTRDTPIAPKRGVIYDRNMKELAVSSIVERVFISPYEIKTPEAERFISEKLSEMLDVDYDFIYQKTQKKNKKDETIKKNVEIAKANEIRQFIVDYEVKGVYLGQETKRYYPYSNLASHIIGFTGADNDGRLGIEMKYEEELKGMPGRIVTAKDGLGKAMPFDYESYIDAKNGNSLVLTIDWTIQNFLEKNLETAYAESQAKERVTGIIMNIHTGEILAMATKPDFDLNNPYELDKSFLRAIEETMSAETFETEEERTAREDKLKNNMLYKMWSNKAVTEPYEPGSTFKVITAATALEEKAVSQADVFTCTGSHVVAGININCHLRGGHGALTFTQGLQQSCNPAIMKAAEKVGVPAFLKYFDAFGFRDKTGIDLPGEAESITHSPDNFRSVELATHSFGQTFKVTPIQQVVGLAATANGGKVVVPRVVKSIIDDEGNIIKNFETDVKRTILSEETSKQLAQILAEGVANDGAARNAYVKGYDVAAKTGTSQKKEDLTDTARIGSCMAFAPADNPQIIILIVVDEPDQNISSIYGGVIAAPYVAKTLADTLPYLGVEPKYTETELEQIEVLVQDYRGIDVSSALKDITSKNLTYTVEGDGVFVIDQIPKGGSSLPKGGKLILYTDNGSNEIEEVNVPNVINMTAAQANEKIIDAGLNIHIVGAENMTSGAVAISQSPTSGETVPIGTIVVVEFRHFDGVH